MVSSTGASTGAVTPRHNGDTLSPRTSQWPQEVRGDVLLRPGSGVSASLVFTPRRSGSGLGTNRSLSSMGGSFGSCRGHAARPRSQGDGLSVPLFRTESSISLRESSFGDTEGLQSELDSADDKYLAVEFMINAKNRDGLRSIARGTTRAEQTFTLATPVKDFDPVNQLARALNLVFGTLPKGTVPVISKSNKTDLALKLNVAKKLVSSQNNDLKKRITGFDDHNEVQSKFLELLNRMIPVPRSMSEGEAKTYAERTLDALPRLSDESNLFEFASKLLFVLKGEEEDSDTSLIRELQQAIVNVDLDALSLEDLRQKQTEIEDQYKAIIPQRLALHMQTQSFGEIKDEDFPHKLYDLFESAVETAGLTYGDLRAFQGRVHDGISAVIPGDAADYSNLDPEQLARLPEDFSGDVELARRLGFNCNVSREEVNRHSLCMADVSHFISQPQETRFTKYELRFEGPFDEKLNELLDSAHKVDIAKINNPVFNDPDVNRTVTHYIQIGKGEQEIMEYIGRKVDSFSQALLDAGFSDLSKQVAQLDREQVRLRGEVNQVRRLISERDEGYVLSAYEAYRAEGFVREEVFAQVGFRSRSSSR